ncbi:hypothetical protein FC68_GL001079 [Companilactobacillus farciminis KCTC 3681 = DSM 20184]|nr:hypothetical protein FC68_GL001079 [Companilactobacillus farciminis KCTC 3681 = DSM 20184]
MYELAIFGVLYFALVTFQIMPKDVNGWLILIGLIILYVVDWAYLRFVKSNM